MSANSANSYLCGMCLGGEGGLWNMRPLRIAVSSLPAPSPFHDMTFFSD